MVNNFIKSFALFSLIFVQFIINSPSLEATNVESDTNSIQGYWQTTIEENGSEMIFVLRFESTDSDSLKCTVHLPELGMSNLAVVKFIYDKDSVVFPGFTGVLQKEKLVGRLSSFGAELDVSFKKIERKPVFTVDCPEKKPDWQYQTGGAIWSSPAIHDNLLVIGNDKGVLYAIELYEKTVKWTFQTEGSIKSKAEFCGDNISFASDDGFLYMLELESGKEQWRTDIGNAVSPRVPPAKDVYDYDFLCSSPVHMNGVIYIGSKDSCLYAIDAVSGAVDWKFKTGDVIRSTPAIDEELVYVGSWDHHMYGINKKDGSLVWKYKTGWRIQSSPLVVDDKVVFGSRSAQVFAVDKTSGKEVWITRYWASWVESSPVLFDGKIYIGSSDFRKVFALDPENGKVLMSRVLEGWAWATPAVSHEYIYIGTAGSLYYTEAMHGRFYAIYRDTGEPVWQLKVKDNPDQFAYGFKSSPVIHDGWVYFGGLDGKMYGLKVK